MLADYNSESGLQPETNLSERQNLVRPRHLPNARWAGRFVRISKSWRLAFGNVRRTPGAIIVDGRGYAHPPRLGIDSHLGVVLDCPAIGCAKSILVRTVEDPADKASSRAPLIEEEGTDRGAFADVRSCERVYVSQGQQLSVDSIIQLIKWLRMFFACQVYAGTLANYVCKSNVINDLARRT